MRPKTLGNGSACTSTAHTFAGTEPAYGGPMSRRAQLGQLSRDPPHTSYSVRGSLGERFELPCQPFDAGAALFFLCEQGVLHRE